MGDRRRHEEAWGESVYAAWRSGGNPDEVDRDTIADDVRDGCDLLECGDREAERQRRRRIVRHERALAGKEKSGG